MTSDLASTLTLASAAAFLLAALSAVAGFGGGVLLLPVFTALFGLQVAVPILTLTQLSSNASRVWLNRRELRWRLIGWFAVGAVPLAVAGGLLLAHTPLGALKRLLGVFLIGVVIWRRLDPHPRKPTDRSFAAVGAASGLGSAMLGSVGPLTAPFFLANGFDPRGLEDTLRVPDVEVRVPDDPQKSVIFADFTRMIAEELLTHARTESDSRAIRRGKGGLEQRDVPPSDCSGGTSA